MKPSAASFSPPRPPRRADLLSPIGGGFTVVPSDAAEARNEQLTAREIALVTPTRKPARWAKNYPDALRFSALTRLLSGHAPFWEARRSEDPTAC